MVIVPGKFTFVATPRTGSRAIVEAILRQYPNAISEYPRDHHTHWSFVPREYPVYTVIRHPLSQLKSWWWHVDGRNDSKRGFLSFIKEYEGTFMPRDERYRLNIYGPIADEFLPYSRDNDLAVSKMGLQDVAVVGPSQHTDRISEQEWQEALAYSMKEFASDWRLYRDVLRTA